MPDYFYHIGIELFQTDSPSPINLSQTFEALNPFTSHQSRTSRNHKYDTMRKTSSFPHSPYLNELIQSSSDDNRIDEVIVDATNDITAGIGTSFAGAQTKAAFTTTEESIAGERGIVHLYRDAEETQGLYRKTDRIPSSELWTGSAQAKLRPPTNRGIAAVKDEDCAILAILAVPSYLTPRDFLAFVGEHTRNAVSHFRMIRTKRLNRYMVLMKFKDGRYARQWQSDWNGKLFNNMEPETCHVVFVKSVEVLQNQDLKRPRGVSGANRDDNAAGAARSGVGSTNKPIAPPTPSLVELPTCPVCLERMDESTGLITNLCQHVFHCTCLEKWSGYGCPVCRFKDDSFATTIGSPKPKKRLNSMGEYEIDDEELHCYECQISQSLWQCLICGVVGCGRYAGKHAYRHFERTSHTFALDLESQRVWDYDRDCYVHRIIANGSSTSHEKLVELPGQRREGQVTALEDADQDLDIAKRENLAFEYTQLLTSQLESQRVYFEDQVAKAVDNKTKATLQAERDAEAASVARSEAQMANETSRQLQEKVEQLEKIVARNETKFQKAEADRKDLQRGYEEQKAFSDTLSKNAQAKEKEATTKRNEIFTGQANEIKTLKEEVATKNFYLESLQEQINDLRMQIAAATKLQYMVKTGELTQEEVEGSALFAGPPRCQDGTTSIPLKSSRLRKQTHGKLQQSPLSQKEPTDEDIETATSQVNASNLLGQVAAMVKEKLGSSWDFKPAVTEKDIIGVGIERQFLVRKADGGFEYNNAVSIDKATEFLAATELIEPFAFSIMRKANISDPARASEMLLAILNNEYEFSPGKSGEDIRQILVQSGALQRKEEEGLYESDGDDQSENSTAKAKSKKKKKNKKKR